MELASQCTACKIFLEGEVGKPEPKALLQEHAGHCKLVRPRSRSLLYGQLCDSLLTTLLHLQRDYLKKREKMFTVRQQALRLAGSELISKLTGP